MAGISQVKLNSIPLDIDPDNYIMLGGRRRGSVHRLIDGDTVYQDRGINPSDLVVQISGVLTDVNTLKALYALYRLKGYSFTLEDYKGMQMTVVFSPGAESFTAKPIYGSNIAYTYTMLLSVVSVDVWFSTSLGFPADS
jgi:hypothetical protein